MIKLPDKFEYKTTITTKLRNDIIEKLKEFNDPTYLEIGSDIGLTCFSLNEFYKNCIAVDIDSNRHARSEAIQAEIESKYKKMNSINRIHGKIDLIDESNYDVVLIDGDHSYDGVKKDFETLLKKNKSNKYYVFFHDYGLTFGGVKNYIDSIKDDYNYFFAGEEKDWNPIGSSPTDDWESVCLLIEKK